jgi:large subunit ribosomal protein L13
MAHHRTKPGSRVSTNSGEERFVDASNQILGRVATYVAKQALDGHKVIVLNAERAVISGTKARVVARAKWKLRTRTLGNLSKGPTHPRRPDTYVRRTIRGMLPWKNPSGKEAFHRIHVYIGTPEEYQGKEIVKLDDADASRLRVPYISVAQLSQEIGGHTF